MADLSFLKSINKPLAILGLGVSGKAVAKACEQAGVAYHAWVDDETTRNALKNDFVLRDFSHDLSNYHALVPAPGIKPSHPIIRRAREQNIKILSDIDLLYLSAPDARFIGITGTNGKSTTTALIGHILEQAGKKVTVGGNIGVAACALPSFDKDGIYVLELSSYQLDITSNPVCDIAVLLNITEDHLDWHGDMAHYVAAKKKIFRPQHQKTQTAVIAVDSSVTKKIASELSPSHNVIAVTPDDAVVTDHPFLKGVHNRQNIAVAFAVCSALGMSRDDIVKHMLTFEGLAHRQKRVATIGNIEFVNDSKATNVDATARALDSFDRIYWIAGGQPTAEGIDGLEKFYPKIRHAFLIGQAASAFAEKLNGHLTVTVSETMDRAVTDAYEAAKQSGQMATVLLAPACKSFDQYNNFEERGNHFERLAHALKKQVAA